MYPRYHIGGRSELIHFHLGRNLAPFVDTVEDGTPNTEDPQDAVYKKKRVV